MTDTFEFTLNNPLTEEQWDMITDVDFDRTDRITFRTKHGKEVEFAKVIRCKDCKHCRVYCRVVNGIRTDYACDILDEHYDPYGKKRVALDDYCRWAEPKDGEE